VNGEGVLWVDGKAARGRSLAGCLDPLEQMDSRVANGRKKSRPAPLAQPATVLPSVSYLTYRSPVLTSPPKTCPRYAEKRAQTFLTVRLAKCRFNKSAAVSLFREEESFRRPLSDSARCRCDTRPVNGYTVVSILTRSAQRAG
jgi:hypothetical protein